MSVPPQPLTVQIMTASLAPGDAIGNYIRTQAAILRRWGVRVRLFADVIEPNFAEPAMHSQFYRPEHGHILWYHYSIYADNLTALQQTTNFTILDYHGITPPSLFSASDSYLRDLCQRAIDLLPTFAQHVDAAVVHSAYTLAELQRLNFVPVYQIPLCIDTKRFAEGVDSELGQSLKQLQYGLFVGRIVPQKDIVATLKLVAAIREKQPDFQLLLVGSDQLTPEYKRLILREIGRLSLTKAVHLLGKVTNPQQLAALFQHATFYIATSEWESFCVPVAESLYFGTPAIVHDVPPLPETGGAGAIVIDKADIASAALHINGLLANDEQYQTLRRAAKQYAVRYTDDKLAENMLTMLKTHFKLA